MLRRIVAFEIVALALLLAGGSWLPTRQSLPLLPGLAAAQTTAMNPRQQRGAAIEGLAQSTGDAAIAQFIDTHVSKQWLDTMPRTELEARLQALRSACAGFGGVLMARVGADATRLTFLQGPRQTSVLFTLETEAPYRIASLELEPTVPSDNASEPLPPFTWENLEDRLTAAAAQGFAGTVLVVRGGEVVLHQGYGLADRDRSIPNTTATIFAIGSVPIDFTKAAILQLADAGKLRLDDPIPKYLQDVPADKQGMTLEHLMTGRSGLPNFHGILGVDADLDLSWIDRDTAIHRILAQPLLFPPGNGEAHSHSAWVLLAAIVELVSKESYGGYLAQHCFAPAGMTRTGLHEDAARFADEQLAVGYGQHSVGTKNTPRYWGRTSWLVMGSGGMQSTPLDLYKWLEAIRSGKLLSPASAAKYWTGGVLAGGDERGFFCMYTEGPGTLMILCSNTHARMGDLASQVGRALVQLVRGTP